MGYQSHGGGLQAEVHQRCLFFLENLFPSCNRGELQSVVCCSLYTKRMHHVNLTEERRRQGWEVLWPPTIPMGKDHKTGSWRASLPIFSLATASDIRSQAELRPVLQPR
jgi:hypothetical protein